MFQDPILNIAIRAARAAARKILQVSDRLDSLQFVKKSPSDIVSEADKIAEHEIISVIRKSHPQHRILSEECGFIEPAKPSDILWIIDPIDGSRNFIHGFPHYAISIAIQIKNRIQYGVIYDPVRDELFTASSGRGAHLNQKRIRVSQQLKFAEALIGCASPQKHSESDMQFCQSVQNHVSAKCASVRNSGSAALDLAYVAAGRLDCCWHMNMRTWDIAAGCLIVQEAGGFVTDFLGQNNFLTQGRVIASNAKLMPLLNQEFQDHLHLLADVS
jgi:myo-inositol-1(or 4)-monophosphatase